jgi:archaellum component FlaC
VQYIGEGYETTEVKDMLDETYMGYATRMRLEGEREGERKGMREGAAEQRRLEKEVERLKREIEELSRRLQTA